MSSICATNRAWSRSGMHQHCFRQGCSSFFSASCAPFRRRRSSPALAFSIRPPSSVNVHRVRPSGGGPQQIAIKWASDMAVDLRRDRPASRAPCDSGPAASPSSTNRLRMRSTVFTCMPSRSAITRLDSRPPSRLPIAPQQNLGMANLLRRAWPLRVIVQRNRPLFRRQTNGIQIRRRDSHPWRLLNGSIRFRTSIL